MIIRPFGSNTKGLFPMKAVKTTEIKNEAVKEAAESTEIKEEVIAAKKN